MATAAPSASSSKETTDYARLCRLLVDVGTQALRDTFDAIHAPANLHKVLAGNKATLQSLRTKKVINPTQWGKLFPAIPNSVSTANFDTTLLMVLLRNICGLPSPITGWDTLPAVTDVTREADIARVKYFRNTVYAHAEHASVDGATFKVYWQDIRDTLVRLGGANYGAAIDNLETECMDPEIEDHYRELLNQWKKDEENTKDKLNEIGNEIGKVMKKLDDLEAVTNTLKEENSVNGKHSSPKEMQRGPVTCKEKYHANEAVEYYCQECKVCICHKCSVMSHSQHNKMDIQQAAAERKTQMAKVFKEAKSKIFHVERKITEQIELMEKSEEELSAAETKMAETVQEIIRGARDHEKAIKRELGEIKETQRRDYQSKLENIQLLASELRSSVEYGEDVIQRDNGHEILEAGYIVDDCEKLLNTEEPKICRAKHVTYHVNTEAINAVRCLIPGLVSASPTDPSQSVVEGAGLKEAKLGDEANFTITTRDSEGNQCYNEKDQVKVKISSSAGKSEEKADVQDCKDGNYTLQYRPNSIGLHDVAVEVNGIPLTSNPWHVQVTPHQYKALHSFGSRGKGRGEFDGPCCIAVSEGTGNIAIAEYNNKRVQLFDSECKYLRTIGDKGSGAKKLGQPTSVAFTASGDVIVTHGEAAQSVSQMSVFTDRGQFIRHLSDHFIDPRSVFVRADGHMIVCDGGDKTINVLSPDGTELRQSISAPHCDDTPSFSCYHKDTFYVFYSGAHCVKTFNKEGVFLGEIGSKGSSDGQMIHPGGLTVDKFNNVIICDRGNGRLLVFEMGGEFINPVNEGMKEPCSVAVTKDGQLLVCDFIKNCIRCFQ